MNGIRNKTWAEVYLADVSLEEILEEQNIEHTFVLELLYGTGQISLPYWVEDYLEDISRDQEEEDR